MRRALALLTLVAAAVAVTTAPRVHAQAAAGVTFKDVTTASGISFRHTNGAFGKKYLPETMGAGVAVLDYDGDGAQDLFFVNSTRWPARTLILCPKGSCGVADRRARLSTPPTPGTSQFAAR